MKKYKKYNLNQLTISFFIIIIITMLFGCNDTVLPNNPPDNNLEDNSNVSKNYFYQIIVADNAEVIKDCTPLFKILTDNENVEAMSFSGNNEDWSEWIDYTESYNQFNIASGNNGTALASGNKTIYVRFKDTNGTILPRESQEPAWYNFEYEMQELFAIKIEPNEIPLKTGESKTFIVKGYDISSKNEVPLDGSKIKWNKSCAVGELSSSIGLQTTYTAPEIMGIRDISASYGSLVTGAKIDVLN